jgi:hypothetical protein
VQLGYKKSCIYVQYRKKRKMSAKKFKFEFSRKNLISRATVYLKIYTRYYEVLVWGGYVPPPEKILYPPQPKTGAHLCCDAIMALRHS